MSILARRKNGSPIVRSTYDVLEVWAERLTAPPDKLDTLSSRENYCSMSFSGDTIVHYGHWDLARIVRDKRGNARLVLLNGDRFRGSGGFGPTTDSRQRDVRSAVERTSVDSIIIPQTALAAAGIEPTGVDVYPIDVRDDRTITNKHRSLEPPGKRHPLMDCPTGTTRVITDTAYGTEDLQTRAFYRAPSSYEGRERWEEWSHDAQSPEDVVLHDEQPFPKRPSILEREEYDEWGESYEEYAHREVPKRVAVRVPSPNKVFVGRSSYHTAERDSEGVWHWETSRHFLGDSLFRARVHETVEVKPSPEQIELYAELMRLSAERDSLRARIAGLGLQPRRARDYDPRTRRYTVPPSAPRNYREILRQAWATEVLHDQLEKVLVAMNVAHDALARSMSDGHSWTGGSRLRITRRRTRWAYFLSSFDYQESTPLYFLCELPYGARPTTVEEAIECLKPPEVLAAEARGLKVTRQGDLFAIPTKLNKRQIRKMLGRHRSATGHLTRAFQKRMRILGTNHTVTEGAFCKGGTVLGRGTMRHEPGGWRGPDHANQRIGDGKTWHLLVRNTVPRQ